MVFKGSAVLSSVLNIVARLEHDRQETQSSLEQQEVTSRDLKDDLEKQDERRVDLLLESVQAGELRCWEVGLAGFRCWFNFVPPPSF